LVGHQPCRNPSNSIAKSPKTSAQKSLKNAQGGWSGRLGYGNTNNIGDNELPASAGDVLVGNGP
jgi:hypothetical protein